MNISPGANCRPIGGKKRILQTTHLELTYIYIFYTLMYAILFLCLHRFWSKRSRSKLTFCNRSAIAFLSPCRHSFFTYSGALSSLRLGCSATIRSILAFAARRKLNCRVAGAGIPGSNGWSSYMVLQLEKIKMGFKGSSQKKNI